MKVVSVKIQKKDYNTLVYWCHANIKGHWQAASSAFIFSDDKDATLFALKWSGQ